MRGLAQCPEPRDQHRIRERLDQVVVGTGVQTFNLVPSMMVQIEEYATGQARDPF